MTGQSLLDFVHVFQAVVDANRNGCGVSECLDVAEPRSVDRLLARGDLLDLARRSAPSVEVFCARQRYITNGRVVDAIDAWWRQAERGSQ